MASSFDNLTIETPEQTSLEFPLAGVGSRFLAMLADSVIQAVAVILLILLIYYAIPTTRLASLMGPQWAFAFAIIALFLINSGYFAFFEAVWNGQTPGKRLAQIRVIKDDGRPISAFDSMARNLLRIVDELPTFYMIGIISVLCSKENKRLGDYVAGTVVVHEKTIHDARPFLETRSDGSGPVYDTSSMTADELNLVEAFLNRRESLEAPVRTSMAAKISKRIAAKVGTDVAGWPQTEQFLERIHEQYRSSGHFCS
jgi:uncharacterized RDD family membrane protein YckC